MSFPFPHQVGLYEILNAVFQKKICSQTRLQFHLRQTFRHRFLNQDEDDQCGAEGLDRRICLNIGTGQGRVKKPDGSHISIGPFANRKKNDRKNHQGKEEDTQQGQGVLTGLSLAPQDDMEGQAKEKERKAAL